MAATPPRPASTDERALDQRVAPLERALHYMAAAGLQPGRTDAMLRAPPVSDVHAMSPPQNHNASFIKVTHSWCLGTAHRLQKSSLDACIEACRKASCGCVQYRSTPKEQNCRWVGLREHRGTSTSRAGFDAWVRAGAEQPPQKSPSAADTRCGTDGIILKASPSGPLVTPPFFMHPPPFDERSLLACYAARHKGEAYASAADAALWLVRALSAHPSRVSSPAEAQLLWMPSAAALSEAAGSCAGSSHYGRMIVAADALRSTSAYRARPQAHFVVNGVASPMRSPLGELGSLVSKVRWIEIASD